MTTLSKDKLYYLASPYSSPCEFTRNSNFKSICLLAADLLKQGYMIYCPIAMSHPISEFTDISTGFEFWEKLDLMVIDRCDGVIVATLPGWDTSVGVTAEVIHAQETGKPVIYTECPFVTEYIPSSFYKYVDQVMQFGAKKHGDHNWVNPNGTAVQHTSNCNSMFHHLSDSYAGVEKDHESGLHPAAHLATRALMLLHRLKKGLK